MASLRPHQSITPWSGFENTHVSSRSATESCSSMHMVLRIWTSDACIHVKNNASGCCSCMTSLTVQVENILGDGSTSVSCCSFGWLNVSFCLEWFSSWDVAAIFLFKSSQARWKSGLCLWNAYCACSGVRRILNNSTVWFVWQGQTRSWCKTISQTWLLSLSNGSATRQCLQRSTLSNTAKVIVSVDPFGETVFHSVFCLLACLLIVMLCACFHSHINPLVCVFSFIWWNSSWIFKPHTFCVLLCSAFKQWCQQALSVQHWIVVFLTQLARVSFFVVLLHISQVDKWIVTQKNCDQDAVSLHFGVWVPYSLSTHSLWLSMVNKHIWRCLEHAPTLAPLYVIEFWIIVTNDSYR